MDNKVLNRNEVKQEDMWDIEALYPSESDFSKDLELVNKYIDQINYFKGRLSQSTENLLKTLELQDKLMITAEKLFRFSSLSVSVEAQNPENQKREASLSNTYIFISEKISWIEPEILKIKELEKIIEDKAFDNYRVKLKHLLRLKQHIFSEQEEIKLSKQAELAKTVEDTFSLLTNVDMTFNNVNGQVLTQSTFSSFLQNADRQIREKAYKEFYAGFYHVQQTLASLLIGSMKRDYYFAQTREFATSLDASLFQDNIDKSVYTNLIDTVHNNLSVLYRYYKLRKKILKVEELKHYDVYVPMVQMPEIHTSYEKACEIIKSALAPLGNEYVDTLYKGLTEDRWVDRYENKGKRSGAFSSGGFTGKPYILLNYKENVLSDIFTLAHEGGHSMHTYYSKNNNPFSCFNYTIFEAEVASTFNEQLLANYLINNAEDLKTRTYIVSKQLDSIVATLFRQTMFAEFELICHSQIEQKIPLTFDTLTNNYKKLLELYFGPEMHFEEVSRLECLRIPHFYNAFYVYKYATGISAAISLSERVLNGSEKELNDYLTFLKSGGSRYPLESLKLAGVDMSSPKPIEDAIKKFESLLNTFEETI